MSMSITLALQLLILLACFAFAIDWFRRFPAPSRFVAPWLPPMHRWPVEQLWKWVEEGSPEPGFLRFFLRDPERQIPPGPGWVSPVDGTVLADLSHQGRRFLVISLNAWDVHVARSPCAAVVCALREHGDMLEPGRADPLRDEPFYFMRHKSAPKQRYLELDTALGLVRVRLITSYLSRRIQLFCEPGQRLEKGERIGRMLFGSTCVLEVDEKLRFRVGVGCRLEAGETIVLERFETT